MTKFNIGISIFTLFIFSLYASNSNGLDKYSLDCSENNAEACFQAAKIYSSEIAKFNKSTQQKKLNLKVSQYYKKSCELGYGKGCLAYGMNFKKELEKDSSKNPLYYFNKACELGEEAACNIIQMTQFKK